MAHPPAARVRTDSGMDSSGTLCWLLLEGNDPLVRPEVAGACPWSATKSVTEGGRERVERVGVSKAAPRGRAGAEGVGLLTLRALDSSAAKRWKRWTCRHVSVCVCVCVCVCARARAGIKHGCPWKCGYACTLMRMCAEERLVVARAPRSSVGGTCTCSQNPSFKHPW
eukprot:1160385-Pelagomonas_calceolata.AAC.8